MLANINHKFEFTSLVVTSSFSETFSESLSFSSSKDRTRSIYTASLSFRCRRSSFSCKREMRVGESGVEAPVARPDSAVARLGVTVAISSRETTFLCLFLKSQAVVFQCNFSTNRWRKSERKIYYLPELLADVLNENSSTIVCVWTRCWLASFERIAKNKMADANVKTRQKLPE